MKSFTEFIDEALKNIKSYLPDTSDDYEFRTEEVNKMNEGYTAIWIKYIWRPNIKNFVCCADTVSFDYILFTLFLYSSLFVICFK